MHACMQHLSASLVGWRFGCLLHRSCVGSSVRSFPRSLFSICVRVISSRARVWCWVCLRDRRDRDRDRSRDRRRWVFTRRWRLGGGGGGGGGSHAISDDATARRYEEEGLFKANAVKDVEKGRRRREGGGERALYEDRGHILCVCMCMVGGTFPAQENCHFFTEPGTLVPMRRVRASKRVRARPWYGGGTEIGLRGRKTKEGWVQRRDTAEMRGLCNQINSEV